MLVVPRPKSERQPSTYAYAGFPSAIALKKAGVNDDDLKPAYLFLSGCHTDMGKQARSANGAESEDTQVHFKESKRLLQKVYGTQQPEVADGPPVNGASQPTLSEPDRRPRANTATQGPSVQQREIQSLRDKNEHLTRTARKAEKALDQLDRDLASERSYRRKLQTRLDDTERDLETLRRAARSLEERLDREAEARRRAEDALAAERRRWEEYVITKRAHDIGGMGGFLSMDSGPMVGRPGVNGV